MTEISTAVAAAECRDEAGYDQTRADVDVDVDREYQQEFVELHRNELDEWVLAANAGGA